MYPFVFQTRISFFSCSITSRLLFSTMRICKTKRISSSFCIWYNWDQQHLRQQEAGWKSSSQIANKIILLSTNDPQNSVLLWILSSHFTLHNWKYNYSMHVCATWVWEFGLVRSLVRRPTMVELPHPNSVFDWLYFGDQPSYTPNSSSTLLI